MVFISTLIRFGTPASRAPGVSVRGMMVSATASSKAKRFTSKNAALPRRGDAYEPIELSGHQLPHPEHCSEMAEMALTADEETNRNRIRKPTVELDAHQC
jgi:hypothetical protein